MADFPPDLILEVARAAGRDLITRGAPKGEFLIRCPRPESHANGDQNPSCRLSPDKNTFYCDVCAHGGGVVELAQLLGVSAPAMKAVPAKRRHKQALFVTRGPITVETQQIFRDELAKPYLPEAWKALGVEEGTVNGEQTVAFPLPSGGYKVCLYRRRQNSQCQDTAPGAVRAG